jgi:hypothetical protein
MVAMCLQHHKEADANAFTKGQLREMKTDPYLRRSGGPPGGTFHWRREQLVVRAGGLTAVGCGVLLRFGNIDAIWLTQDSDGYELVNLDVWNPDGSLLFSMRDNDWVALGPLDDMECPPSARSLIARMPSQGIRLALEFSALSGVELHGYFHRGGAELGEEMNRHREESALRAERSGAPEFMVDALRGERKDPEQFAAARADELMEAVRRATSATDFALCEIDARLIFPAEIRLTPTRLVLPGNNVIQGGTIIGGGVAVQIG